MVRADLDRSAKLSRGSRKISSWVMVQDTLATAIETSINQKICSEMLILVLSKALVGGYPKSPRPCVGIHTGPGALGWSLRIPEYINDSSGYLDYRDREVYVYEYKVLAQPCSAARGRRA